MRGQRRERTDPPSLVDHAGLRSSSAGGDYFTRWGTVRLIGTSVCHSDALMLSVVREETAHPEKANCQILSVINSQNFEVRTSAILHVQETCT